jgi:arsenical pump membrane protein
VNLGDTSLPTPASAEERPEQANQADQPDGGDLGDVTDARDDRALAAIAVRLAGWVAALVVIGVVDPDPSVSLLLLALLGVVTIVSESRFRWERRLEAIGLPSREGWVPLALLATMAAFDLIDVDHVTGVMTNDGPVIAFILSFALIAEGLRRSGFIQFLAYRLSERGGGSTTRLTLYLFLLSSVLTYFTSNDIVILTMTPIVVSVAYQARIRNAKLLLLSQFIAANTVSMGLLVGSPTNLILGRALQRGFFEYLLLMVAPAAMALMATFIFVTWVNRLVERRAVTGGRIARALVGGWAFSPVYTPPRFSEHRLFTRQMRHWVLVFVLSVALLAASTASSARLAGAAAAIAVVGIVSLWRDARARGERAGRAFAYRTFKALPVGIVFFGLTYFVVADAVADAPFVTNEVDSFVTEHASSHTPVASWGSILASGALVNTMNDLPASALVGNVLPRVDFETPFDQALVVQGALVGVNIATYVTPVGALAGIIWFDMLRKERERNRASRASAPGSRQRVPVDVEMPRRQDLVVYGTATFLAMAAVLGATNFGIVAVGDVLLGPSSGGTDFSSGPGHAAWTVGCLLLVVAVVVTFRRVLATGGVALAHLGDLLVVVTRVRLWASRHRLAFAAIVAGTLFVSSGTLLYWVEQFHEREYDRTAQFDGPGEFVTWLVVFVSSGFESDRFPRSVIGNVLAAALALGSIAALVVLVRLSTASNDLTLRQKLASGEIPTDRLVIVNAAADNLSLVRTLVDESSRFVTVATRDPSLDTLLELRRSDRLAVVRYEDTSSLVADLRLAEAREIVVLSRSVADDFDNLALLGALDAALPGRSGGTVERGAASVTAPLAPVTVAEDGPRHDLPAILLQAHGRELPHLVERRLSTELRSVVARPPFQAVVRRLLVAEAAGSPEAVRQLYRGALTERLAAATGAGEAPGSRGDVDDVDDVDRHLRVHEQQFSLRVEPDTPEPGGLTRPDAVGVEVLVGGRPDWRTFAAMRADELPRPVTGTVVVAPVGPEARTGPAPAAAAVGASADDDGDGNGDGDGDGHAAGRSDPAEDVGAGPGVSPDGSGDQPVGARSSAYVVGSGSLAQWCALDLAEAGVGEVTLLVDSDEALMPAVEDDARVVAVRCGNERDATEVLMRRRRRDEAIVVIDDVADRTFDTDELLQRLSVARLNEADAGHPVPPLYICCRGPARAQRVANFVVDEVIDATWVESSYCAVFATVYFDVVYGDQDLADWSIGRRVAVAHDIASRLCHLDVQRPSDLWFEEPGTGMQSAATMTGAAVVRADRAAPSSATHGPLIGVAHLGVDRDPSGEPIVTVDIEVPASDEPLSRGDLLLGLPYL